MGATTSCRTCCSKELEAQRRTEAAIAVGSACEEDPVLYPSDSGIEIFQDEEPELDEAISTTGSSYFMREVAELRHMLVVPGAQCQECRGPHRFLTDSVYTGEWLGNKRHGYGEQRWKDGATFQGQWRHNCVDGIGLFMHSHGGSYIGQWRGNVAHGYGIFREAEDKSVYHGEWHEDLQQGHGVEVCPRDGTQYEGQFVQGSKHGFGVFHWPNGSQYCGAWEANMHNGKGEFFGHDGHHFRGTWLDALAHGSGRCDRPDQHTYWGQHAKDEKHGFGVFFTPDGQRYEGFWQNGKQHGHGRVLRGGKWQKSEWQHGAIVEAAEGTSECSTQVATQEGEEKEAEAAAATSECPTQDATQEAEEKEEEAAAGTSECPTQDATLEAMIVKEEPMEDQIPVFDALGLPAQKLTFTIIGARGFRNSKWLPSLGQPHCYVVVLSKGQQVCNTNVAVDFMEPRWNEEFCYETWQEGDDLEFRLYDTGSDFLGKATILHDSFRHGFNGDLQLEATDKDDTSEKRCAVLHVKIKPPGTFYPPGPLPEFEVTLTKGKAKTFGIDVDMQDARTLFITGIIEGPITAHNRQAKPEHQLVRGDFIIEANGAAGDPTKMLDRFKEDRTIVAKIRRAIDMTLILERKMARSEDGTEGCLQPLGIIWPRPLNGRSLVVLEINAGLFADWNESQAEVPASKVQVGDRIMRVGSTSGSAEKIAKAIQEVSGKFQLALVRAPRLFHE